MRQRIAHPATSRQRQRQRMGEVPGPVRLPSRRKSFVQVAATFFFLAGATLVFASESDAQEPGALPSPPNLSPEQMREDLEALQSQFLDLDLSFSDDERRAFHAILDETAKRTESLSVAGFALEVARAVAVSDNGHTTENAPSWFRRLPIRVWWFTDGLHVVEAHPAFADLIGARVERIDDLSPEEALQRVTPFIPGAEPHIRVRSARELVTLEVLHHIGAARDRNRATLTFRTPEGELVERELGPEPDRNPGSDYQPWVPLLPEPFDLSGRWPHVLDDAPQIPLTYRPRTDLEHEWVADGVLYLRSNRIYSEAERASRGETDLDDKLTQLLFDVVAAEKPRHVIVDLRYNDGGNFFNTILFAQGLASLVPEDGRISVLTGPVTFSAALVTAAFIKDHAPDRTAFVGAAMGDFGRFWAEGGTLTLPNSGLRLRYSNGFQDWEDGCAASGDCTFWPAIAYGVSGVSLAPDIEIGSSFSDYAAGRDPVMEAAMAAAER